MSSRLPILSAPGLSGTIWSVGHLLLPSVFQIGVTLFGAGRQFSFDVEEPTFREAETIVKNEIESWFIPVWVMLWRLRES